GVAPCGAVQPRLAPRGPFLPSSRIHMRGGRPRPAARRLKAGRCRAFQNLAAGFCAAAKALARVVERPATPAADRVDLAVVHWWNDPLPRVLPAGCHGPLLSPPVLRLAWHPARHGTRSGPRGGLLCAARRRRRRTPRHRAGPLGRVPPPPRAATGRGCPPSSSG